MALSTHVAGEGAAAATFSQCRTGLGAKFLYLCLVGMGSGALGDTGIPVTATSINLVKNQTQEPPTWAKGG